MKESEMKILTNLRKDARISLACISQEIEVPSSTIYDRIHKLCKDKVIKKYCALVDFSKLGFHHHAKLAIKIDRDQKEDLIGFLKKDSCLNSLHEINNGFSLFAETVHRDIKEYTDFVDELKERFKYAEVQEYQVINEIKNEEFMAA